MKPDPKLTRFRQVRRSPRNRARPLETAPHLPEFLPAKFAAEIIQILLSLGDAANKLKGAHTCPNHSNRPSSTRTVRQTTMARSAVVIGSQCSDRSSAWLSCSAQYLEAIDKATERH